MIESRNDLILRILDEIAFLTARMAGLKALGMNDEIAREVERLEEAAKGLDEPDRVLVRTRLDDLNRSSL